MEWLNLTVTMVFFVVLLYFVFSSALLEGKCVATLLTGQRVKYDPFYPPNFTDQFVWINISPEKCARVTVCHEQWECNYTYDYDECFMNVGC